jgi:hypothetical protein
VVGNKLEDEPNLIFEIAAAVREAGHAPTTKTYPA